MVLEWTYKDPTNTAPETWLLLALLYFPNSKKMKVLHFLFSRLHSYLKPHFWKWGADQQVSRKRTPHWIWPMLGPCFPVSPCLSSQLCCMQPATTYLLTHRKSSMGSLSQLTQELLQRFDSCQPSLQVHNTIWYHSENEICISPFLVYASNPTHSKNRPACLQAVTYYFKTSQTHPTFPFQSPED